MARVMPIMSQGQHLKSNKNTEDKIALFHCRFGERGVLMLIYIIEVVGVVFFCILKET